MSDQPTHLSTDDQRVLDALIEVDFDPSALPAADRARGEKLAEVMGLLDHLPAPSPGDLLAERTIAAVTQARYRGQDEDFGSAGGWKPPVRLGDLIAVAAVLIVAISIAIPSLDHSRANHHKAVSQANMAGAFSALTQYASAYDDHLPQVQHQPGSQWWHYNQVDADGNALSNSMNQFVLLRTGHAQPKVLISPTNRYAPVRINVVTKRDWANAREQSYSMQNLFVAKPVKLEQSNTAALMGDKNPLIGDGRFNTDLTPDANSANHGDLGGQNVLLRDGQVIWLTTPYLNGDNIWTNGDNRVLEGNERPVDDNDSFLAQ